MLGNLIFSVGVKGLQALLGFAVIHHLISTWGQSRYGIWVTMTSLIAYTTMFDLGVGYGIKNKISEAHGIGRLSDAEAHARFGLLFYAGATAAMFCVGLFFIPYVSPFKENAAASVILWTGFAISFLFSYANIILQALGRFRILSGVGLLAPGLWFVFLLLFNSTSNVSPLVAAVVYSALLVCQSGLLVLAVRKVWDFNLRGRLHESLALARSLLATGAKFFALQLASLALFYSGTYLAFHSLGPSEVARYDAANKVFSIFSIGFSILVSIAWTEISKAKSSRNGLRLMKVFLLLHGSAALVGLSAVLVAWWSPLIVSRLTNVQLDTREALPFALLVTVQSVAFSSAVYLNAFEKLKGQVLLALLSIPLFFLFAFLLLNGGGGIGAIPLASAAATLPATLFCFWVALSLIRAAHTDFVPVPAC